MVRSQIVEFRIYRHPEDRRRQIKNHPDAQANNQSAGSDESAPCKQQHFRQPTRKPQGDHRVRASQVRRLANLLPIKKPRNFRLNKNHATKKMCHVFCKHRLKKRIFKQKHAPTDLLRGRGSLFDRQTEKKLNSKHYFERDKNER